MARKPAKKVAARRQEITVRASRMPRNEPQIIHANEPGSTIIAVLASFERLAVNPKVNPDALAKLLDVQERLLDRQAKMAFDEAFVRMQPLLPVITKDGRIIVREKDERGRRTGEKTQDTPYAKWETIVPLVKPILQQHGFALNHTYSMIEGRVRVTAHLRGHGWTDSSCYIDLPADTTGSKNTIQGWGSSTSYGKRYTGCAVLNIVTVGEDDDGKNAGRAIVAGEPISPGQREQIVELASAVLCGEPHLIKHLNSVRPKDHPEIEHIEDLPSSRFDECIAALRSYDANRRERERQAEAAAAR